MEVIVRKIKRDDTERATKFTEALQTLRELRHELEAENSPNASLPDQLYHWHKVRSHYDAIKAIANEAEQLSRKMSYEQLPFAFRNSKIPTSTVKLTGIGRFTLSQRTTARVLDWPLANDWLGRYGHKDAVREMVPASTMNSIVGELMKGGIEPPKEAIESNTYSYTSFTKE
jgi:hypothetical protein